MGFLVGIIESEYWLVYKRGVHLGGDSFNYYLV